MLVSEDKEDKDFAVPQILKSVERISLETGARKNQVLNIAATSLMDLINCNGGKEPVFSC